MAGLLALAAPAGAGPWANSANGGGVDDYGPDGGPDYAIEFDARVSAEGEAEGEAEGQVTWLTLDGTVISSGPVYCLVVRDNRAYILWWTQEPSAGNAGFTRRSRSSTPSVRIDKPG